MRQFLTGLLLGLAIMYWYAYQKDDFVSYAQTWFAHASHDAGADAKIKEMAAARRR